MMNNQIKLAYRILIIIAACLAGVYYIGYLTGVVVTLINQM